ncbi:MAG: CoA transferase, partial [Pseudomonadota bacterium]
LMKANPKLIVARISGYGQTGPYKDRTGFGGVAECMGGWRKIVGNPDGPPARMGVSIGDSLAASYTAMGILAALHVRNQTGLGQIIDTALYESVLQVMEAMIPEYAVTGHKRTRTGAILPKIAPSSVYPCLDGEYMIGANGDAIFARLCDAMNMPELAQDARYKTHLARGEYQLELDEIIACWTKTKTIDELSQLMLQNGVPASRLYDAEDMLADPHFAAREAIISVPDNVLGETKMQGTFPKLSRNPSSVRRAAPREIGQDTDEILARWLGR